LIINAMDALLLLRAFLRAGLVETATRCDHYRQVCGERKVKNTATGTKPGKACSFEQYCESSMPRRRTRLCRPRPDLPYRVRDLDILLAKALQERPKHFVLHLPVVFCLSSWPQAIRTSASAGLTMPTSGSGVLRIRPFCIGVLRRLGRVPSACGAKAHRESDRMPSGNVYRHVQGFR
jgi:hypothetical protein